MTEIRIGLIAMGWDSNREAILYLVSGLDGCKVGLETVEPDGTQRWIIAWDDRRDVVSGKSFETADLALDFLIELSAPAQ